MMKRFFSWRLAIAGVTFAVLALPAQAGLFDDEEARKAILDLRQKVDSQHQGLSEENAQLRRSMLELSNQIETLKSELANMRGQNEQFMREVSEMQRRQKDLAQGIDARMAKFEPLKVQVDGKDFQADPAEKRDYEAALATFRKGDFAAAEPEFVNFIRRNPQSGYVPSSLFWLGNAQYALRNYRDAITNFRNLYTQNPDHARAPESMLAMANCQIELKDNRGARATLDNLIRTYPQSEAAGTAKERLVRLPKQ
jgi:tol-pal system protein YbgF